MRLHSLAQILLLTSTKADQPVSCLREQVYGLWEFHVNTQVDNVNLFQTNEVCSHHLTNKVQIIEKSHSFSFA